MRLISQCNVVHQKATKMQLKWVPCTRLKNHTHKHTHRAHTHKHFSIVANFVLNCIITPTIKMNSSSLKSFIFVFTLMRIKGEKKCFTWRFTCISNQTTKQSKFKYPTSLTGRDVSLWRWRRITVWKRIQLKHKDFSVWILSIIFYTITCNYETHNTRHKNSIEWW